MTRESIISKITRLLALADKGRNNSTHEAEAAAALAAKLMREHRIEGLELVADGETEAEPMETVDLYDGEGPKKRVSWKSVLAGGLSRANGCRTVNAWRGGWRDPRRTLLILGRRDSVQAVGYLYSYLVREVEAVTKRASKGLGRAYANSFRLGMASRIASRVQEAARDHEVQQTTETTALVRRDDLALKDYTKTAFPNLQKSPIAHSSGFGYGDGQAAGGRVNLQGGKGLGAPATQVKGRQG